MRGRRNNHANEDYRTVQRVRQAVEGYVAEYGENVPLNPAHILDLLNPRGAWSLDPDRARRARAARRLDDTGPMDPVPSDADPLTGCKPVTAQDEAPQ